MKTVMLITIHGMGKEDTDYYKTLEEKLSKEMIDDSIRVIICPIRYAKLFQDNQNHIWDQYLYTPSFKLSFQWLRKFFLYYFSDAASVEFAAHRNSPLYTDLQQNIYDTIMQKFNSIKSENENISVAIIAHSLGCQVMSNYIYDIQNNLSIFKNRDKIPENSFGRLGSLKNIISTGCNIPLFVSGLPERKCFNLNNIQWDNYYSPKDILGWPLSILDTSFSGIQDHSINVGNVLTRWNPLCHSAYWSNNKIVKIVADKLRGL